MENALQENAYLSEHQALASRDPDAHPGAFADVRERLCNKVGQPIVIAESKDRRRGKNSFPLSAGILRSERPLFLGQLELGFHTGPVAWTWYNRWVEPVREREGPLRLPQTETLLFLQHREGLRPSDDCPEIIVGYDELTRWKELLLKGEKVPSAEALEDILTRLITAASVEDPDPFGRTKERTKLITRMQDVAQRYEPDFGSRDAIDVPECHAIAGEMALCLRRAKQLELDHPLVERFNWYLSP